MIRYCLVITGAGIVDSPGPPNAARVVESLLQKFVREIEKQSEKVMQCDTKKQGD